MASPGAAMYHDNIKTIGAHMQWPRLKRQCTHDNPRMMANDERQHNRLVKEKELSLYGDYGSP